jgi:hypothetical protein
MLGWTLVANVEAPVAVYSAMLMVAVQYVPTHTFCELDHSAHNTLPLLLIQGLVDMRVLSSPNSGSHLQVFITTPGIFVV